MTGLSVFVALIDRIINASFFSKQCKSNDALRKKNQILAKSISESSKLISTNLFFKQLVSLQKLKEKKNNIVLKLIHKVFCLERKFGKVMS